MIPDVLVAGAGCAGLAAATLLAEQGARVRLLEARPVLGGRSRSWIDRRSGDVEDNGQHILMGCYAEFLDMLRRTGGIDELRFQPRLDLVLIEPGGRVARFRPGALPRPLDLLWGLLRLRGFPLADIFRARSLVREVSRPEFSLEGWTVERWLTHHGQSEQARRLFWDPLVLATLNLAPRAAPADLLAEVLRRALLGGAEASRIGFASNGLGPLIVDPARRFLERHGAEIETGCKVTELAFDDRGRFDAALGRDGRRHRAGAMILAVPHREAASLIGGHAAPFDARAASTLGASAIVAIHLWFDRRISSHAIAGLVDSPIHWVFDRVRIGGASAPGYLALVASAAAGLARQDPGSLVGLARNELSRFFPLARDARLVRWRVLKERRATPRLGPDHGDLRPPATTGASNLMLAGDWTATGLPATLEGAAASGHRAAESLRKGG